ncbi:gliding motility-associated C-terminal domain-containing protein [Flavobacterium sp.]|uniref:gliding motility-associated C-terminal domain-containing protein n=1 Tax=Flavobacterium sp. TaxID=239 RepID=UPI00286CB2FE|nr:gliding motility-associated C-terminal domain-containing protein [Flavobacterium sp.]
MRKIYLLLLLNGSFAIAQNVPQKEKQHAAAVPPIKTISNSKDSHLNSFLKNEIDATTNNSLLTPGQCATSVVPPATLNGILVTETFSGSVLIYPDAYFSCGNVTTPANSKWFGSNGAFSYTMNFSQPINNLIIALTATGNTYNEIFTFTTNGGTPAITSSASCFSSISGNVITSGENSSSNGGGGGIFTITAPNSFTSLNISGPGGQNGSLLSICSNSIEPVNCNVGSFSPSLSATTLRNLCNVNSVNLNSITASNTPQISGVSLAWFTGATPAASNQLTTAQAAAQPIGPTYYAAFYDSVNQCYSTTTAVTTTPLLNQIPTFNAIAPICIGTVTNPLVATSNNGVHGVWSPAFNNLATTLYTFTPDAGQCASNTSLTIQVLNQIPTFDLIDPICSGDVLNPLLATSNNGILGVWSPAFNNTTTTLYTFTPNAGQCSSNTSLTIAVNPKPQITITAGCNGKFFELTAHADIENTSFLWYDVNDVLLGNLPTQTIATPGIYHVVGTADSCKGTAMQETTSVYCDIPKGISPNDDGWNEFFELSNLNVKSLEVFNRYGTKVYNKNNYKNEWKGEANNGQELPDGVYYYVIDFENAKSKTGWVYINR